MDTGDKVLYPSQLITLHSIFKPLYKIRSNLFLQGVNILKSISELPIMYFIEKIMD